MTPINSEASTLSNPDEMSEKNHKEGNLCVWEIPTPINAELESVRTH